MAKAKTTGIKAMFLQVLVVGMVVTVPILVTVGVIWWLSGWFNDKAVALLGGPKTDVGYWVNKTPGAGIGMMLVLILAVGALMRFWFFRRVVAALEWLVQRIPLVKTLYGGLRDLLRFFGGADGDMGKVVLFRVPGTQAAMLAILTSHTPRGLPPDQARGRVAIYLPMSYQLGGFLLYVPADSVQPLDMSVEEMLKLAATAEAGVAPKPPLL